MQIRANTSAYSAGYRGGQNLPARIGLLCEAVAQVRKFHGVPQDAALLRRGLYGPLPLQRDPPFPYDPVPPGGVRREVQGDPEDTALE